MDLKQRLPPYDYKSSFWPPAGIMMMCIIVVRAREYNDKHCGAKFWLLSPALLKFVEYGLEATPAILWLQIVFWLAAEIMMVFIIVVRAKDYNYSYCGAKL